MLTENADSGRDVGLVAEEPVRVNHCLVLQFWSARAAIAAILGARRGSALAGATSASTRQKRSTRSDECGGLAGEAWTEAKSPQALSVAGSEGSLADVLGVHQFGPGGHVGQAYQVSEFVH